ncbi:MAG: hydrolase [Acidobacteriota bacterium]|nr:hydrolase [Acidobacteriota bacterium]
MNPSSLPELGLLTQEPAARRMLEAERAALVVIDIQEKLLPAVQRQEELVRNTQLLIRLAGILEIPVVATTQYARGLGATVAPIAELLGGVTPVDKTEFGCFGQEKFRDALRVLPGHRTTLLLCGMESHICVLQTALGALEKGYLVHAAADAISSRTEQNWQLGLERMRDAGCVISSTEMMMYELLRKSGTKEFKELLKYIK